MADKKLDGSPVDQLARDIQKDTDSHQIYDSGYKIEERVYAIPYTGASHTTIELRGPMRPDGTRMYADLDTYTMGDKGGWSTVPYQPGSQMRMALDFNRKDNSVTTDANLLKHTTVAEGRGPDVLLKFAQMVEQAQELNANHTKYHPFSVDGYLGMSKEEWANSNSGPRQVLDNLGYDTHHIGADSKTPHAGGDDMHKDFENYHWKPGSNDDVSRDFKKPAGPDAEHFKNFQGNPDRLIQDPAELAKMNKLFTAMHPDSISNQMKLDAITAAGVAAAAKSPKP